MLTRYVDTKIAPGDLVAIIRTAGGVGTLQQFTTDRRLLHAAIDRVRCSLQSRKGVGAFEAITPASSTSLVTSVGQTVDELRTEVNTAGTLGALEYVLRGIEELPGRKSVVFVSEGFDLGIRDAKASRTWSAFTRVMDRANRAGVVVYTMDARGLQTGGLTAEDDAQTKKIAMPGRRSAPPTPAHGGPRASHRPPAGPDRFAGLAGLPGPADRRLRGAQHQRPGRRHGARHRRHARLLPARLRHVDPDERAVGPERHPHPRQAARAHRQGAARPVRAGRQGAPARRGAGRSAGRRHAVALRHRRHRRAPHHAVRARQDGRLVRPVAVLHRSGRADLRRRRRWQARGRPVAAAARGRGQRADVRPDPHPGAAAARGRGLRAAAPARPALQRAAGDQGGRRLPDPRRRAGRSLEGDRDERPVRRGAEGRQGCRRPVGRPDGRSRRPPAARPASPRPPRRCGPT